MNVTLVEVVREEWLATLVSAEKNIDSAHKQKWADLKLGADRSRGHRVVWVLKDDHELITKAANESVSRQAGPKLGG